MRRSRLHQTEAPLELESQFILRVPEEPAKVLKELLRSGGDLRDRCTVRLENDMRYGEVRVDHWLMQAKVVDLPTVIESLKTTDNKSFYKTADICQMMICKEEADQSPPDEENVAKNEKKDPLKVEKKFLWPHGIAPPAKNVRKRRFRKTIKKKYDETHEIEKEVKRLLRIDYDAVSVNWEVLSEKEDSATEGNDPTGSEPGESRPVKKESAPEAKQENRTPKREQTGKSKHPGKGPGADAERDILGGAVNDSDEKLSSNLNAELDYNSRLSEYDSRDSDSVQDGCSDLPTQFASDMFREKPSGSPSGGAKRIHDPVQYRNRGKENAQQQMEQLHQELQSLRNQRTKMEREVASMENLALRQRFREFLDNITQDIAYKEAEYRELQNVTH